MGNCASDVSTVAVNPRDHPEKAENKTTTTKRKEFQDLYTEGKQLGAGGFSKVFVGQHTETRITYAVKRVECKNMVFAGRNALDDEINNMMRLSKDSSICHHFVRLHETYHENGMCYLVMEHLKGGHLYNRLAAKRQYTEREARDVCRNLLEAVDAMHGMRIVHRDLKPENLLLPDVDCDTNIKIADFGFSKKCLHQNALHTLCGTEGYMAPEILASRPAYDLKCDLWSVGVILYELLGGCSPFRYTDSKKVMEATCNGEYSFDPKYFGGVSEKAKLLVSCLMTVDPSKRYSSYRALQHEWFEENEESLSNELSSERLRQLVAAQAKRKMKAAVDAVCILNKLEALQKFDGPLAIPNAAVVEKARGLKSGSLSTRFRAAVYTVMATRKIAGSLTGNCSPRLR
eukprot:CAMPEP_0116844798 /NCGR_PEP_ID=MMETSP0418-20121206/12901_1 /TAXON_ID=1158023 /ORGANISM="Astrosyne radiata, Strain 13vi08-1A" /LENGTH=401 /DNA_ID=CAMNT_0004475817 /DNA_START=350 /DNA_END=1555 /DNA_ORIENTATION=+